MEASSPVDWSLIQKRQFARRLAQNPQKSTFCQFFNSGTSKQLFLVPPINFYDFPASPNKIFSKMKKKIRFFENFQFFSKNGCCFNKMALRYQRYVTNDCFWDVSNPNNMKKYFFRNLPGYYHIIPT